MLFKKSKPVPLFSVNKKHSSKERLFRFFEFVLILVVILGTVSWLVFNSRAAIGNYFSGVFGDIKPQVASQKVNTTQTPEEELSGLLKGIVQVETVTKTSDNFLEVKTKEGVFLIFSQEKNLADQVRTLQTVMAKAKIDKRSLKKVDFRFEKIVVEY